MHRRLATALLLALPFSCLAAIPTATIKHLSGTVSGSGGAPLPHASVKLQNTKSRRVSSRVTDAAGHYRFDRIDPNAEFRVWATWHQHHSGDQHITKFDTDLDQHRDLSVPTR